MRLYKFIKLPRDKQIEAFNYLTLVKAKDRYIFKAKDVFELPYKDFDYIRRLISSGELTDIVIALNIVFRIPKFVIPFLKVNTFFGMVNYIISKLEIARERESKLDMFVDENKRIAMEMSKASRLGQFGIYNLIDSLANGDKTKWDYFENLTYNKIYFMNTFVTLQGTVNRLFEKNYNDIMKSMK